MPVIKPSSWNKKPSPDTIVRIVSALCYLTVGLAGIIYIIFQGKHSQAMFFRFHFLQSIILGIIGLLLGWTIGIFVNISEGILGLFPGISNPGQIVGSIAFGMQMLLNLGSLLMLYGLIFSLIGRYAEIPLISKLVRQQLR
ncbi:MAG TPA: hypothetical protein V6D17_17645 [Candidatus Obscuribacterales bacterium]